jgi:hypothetical protein
MMTTDELKNRLADNEDRFTERKASCQFSDVIKAIVAFANSVPENRTAVMFIGVNDRGEIVGVENPDKQQKTIRNICENECYPAIWVNMEVLQIDGKAVIAVEVPYCRQKPYFAGPAYIRIGSESIKASDELYKQLLLRNIDKLQWIIDRKEIIWKVEGVGKGLGITKYRVPGNVHESAECKIEEITPYFIRFKNIENDTYFTEELCFVNISWDDKGNRPKIIIRYPM